jgi:hypothetical protein
MITLIRRCDCGMLVRKEVPERTANRLFIAQHSYDNIRMQKELPEELVEFLPYSLTVLADFAEPNG